MSSSQTERATTSEFLLGQMETHLEMARLHQEKAREIARLLNRMFPPGAAPLLDRQTEQRFRERDGT